jgi:hypothetical protein
LWTATSLTLGAAQAAAADRLAPAKVDGHQLPLRLAKHAADLLLHLGQADHLPAELDAAQVAVDAGSNCARRRRNRSNLSERAPLVALREHGSAITPHRG